MSSVTSTALHAMDAAMTRFGAAAGRIASGVSDTTADDVVELLTARRDFEANLLVLEVEADMIDRLLDIRA